MEPILNQILKAQAAEQIGQLCSTQFSKSTISDLCKNLDPIRKGWNSRPLKDSGYPFVIVGARIG
ncbi:MAG: putative transposase [Eubacteriales bacterium]|nr:putative transposase [Eubacteriales bacterium]